MCHRDGESTERVECGRRVDSVFGTDSIECLSFLGQCHWKSTVVCTVHSW